ncbi:4-alpha-glucanotransferase [Thermodesulfobacteriota bacterium]
MMELRGSGLLLHISSLPGQYGIGDLGSGARAFVDFLAASGQRYWQFLPIGPCSRIFDSSPYMSLSAFAGNPLLVDPDQLNDAGLLSNDDLQDRPEMSEYTVEFDKVIPFKTALLRRAHANFKQHGDQGAFDEFCRGEAAWLDDYALFMAIRNERGQEAWCDWPKDLAGREEKALAASRQRLADEIGYQQFVQYCFLRQWQALREYAASRGVFLIGDIPIYVSFDSADVWAHRHCFRLDPHTFQPTHVAGVPPDYFSATGQRWGNPLYGWQLGNGEANDSLYGWWRERFRHIFKTVDIVRIDHFRGFEAFWEIPDDEETAINGRWVKGPGKPFFDAMASAIGELPIIAEDLGVITPEVEKLRADLGFPGMKVLQFAFDSDADNLYLPHNYPDTNCVVYTGTHDNDTSLGWFLSPEVSDEAKARVRRYANSNGDGVHWDFLRLAFSSVAKTAIVPMQDLLGFGADCRMNTPSTCEGNWRWRCADRFMSEALAAQLRDETCFYGRCR